MRSFSSASPRSVAPANKTPSLLGSASTSVTRRSAVAVLALTAAPLSVLAAANNAHAQASQAMPEKSLYERLGGVFAIAAVVDHFSDAVVKNPIVGQTSKNPQLRVWHTKNLGRLPGLKFMRAVGLQRFWRPLPVRGHQARQDAARPRGSPSESPDLTCRIR